MRLMRRELQGAPSSLGHTEVYRVQKLDSANSERAGGEIKQRRDMGTGDEQ